MDIQDRTIHRVLLSGMLLWGLGAAIHSAATAHRRCVTELDDTLRTLRQESTDALGLPSVVRAQCLSDLRSPDDYRRWTAAAKLAKWGDRGAVPAIIAAMYDDKGTRRTCLMAQALGKIGSPEALPALIGVLDHPRNLDLRQCATHALAEIGDERAVHALIQKAIGRGAARDDRVSAIIALGDMGFAEALPVLQTIAMNDPDERLHPVARSSILKIAILQPSDPVPELIQLLWKPEPLIYGDWVLRQLHDRWDGRVSEALNEYVVRPAPYKQLTLATAILLHRDALNDDTLLGLATSEKKHERWIADYIAEHATQTALAGI